MLDFKFGSKSFLGKSVLPNLLPDLFMINISELLIQPICEFSKSLSIRKIYVDDA